MILMTTSSGTPSAVTYSLDPADPDAASFAIDSSSGQLTTRVELDYETKSQYMVDVIATDGTLSNTIEVIITVMDANDAPMFDSETAERMVAENTPSGVNIGMPVTAMDADGDTLIYSISDSGDAGEFMIQREFGQLRTDTVLNYEVDPPQTTYTVTVTATDTDEESDTIEVTINVTNVNEAPVFGTISAPVDDFPLSVAENMAGALVGMVSAEDPDEDDTLTYSLDSADPDSASFEIDRTTGQLKTRVSLNHEAKDEYMVDVIATDAGGETDTATVTIMVGDMNEAPMFTEGDSTSRSVPENVATTVGPPVIATDPDDRPNGQLTYRHPRCLAV